ncbi:ACT domain-containing protein [Nocardia terpenica]|uniref:ACT domain-containing protein n=1 Tax=Nocardia terpenica TaxID=455432 RepID=UPI000B092DB1|nr:ACT domain-containing protein [Nocardia terpenica]
MARAGIAAAGRAHGRGRAYGVELVDGPTTVEPLGDAGISAFLATTYHADLVLVPEERREEAAAVLREAGHQIVG